MDKRGKSKGSKPPISQRETPHYTQGSKTHLVLTSHEKQEVQTTAGRRREPAGWRRNAVSPGFYT